MKKLPALSILLIIFAGCKKSGGTDPKPDSNTMRVQITSNMNFDYGISEWAVAATSLTIDKSGTNVSGVDYSFDPVPGQDIEIGASTSTVSNLTLKVTYKGRVYGPTSSSNTGGTTLDFKFEVPSN
ncbi:MAG: hypothetical protein JST32_08020, partial [Bacteroidetes bacterium]|nr:hypothetical protein [Bacteroidota bacterium]